MQRGFFCVREVTAQRARQNGVEIELASVLLSLAVGVDFVLQIGRAQTEGGSDFRFKGTDRGLNGHIARRRSGGDGGFLVIGESDAQCAFDQGNVASRRRLRLCSGLLTSLALAALAVLALAALAALATALALTTLVRAGASGPGAGGAGCARSGGWRRMGLILGSGANSGGAGFGGDARFKSGTDGGSARFGGDAGFQP